VGSDNLQRNEKQNRETQIQKTSFVKHGGWVGGVRGATRSVFPEAAQKQMLDHTRATTKTNKLMKQETQHETNSFKTIRRNYQ
jgi:hypothetical protein